MLKDSLFAKYLKDRQGIEVLESEFGFITYKLNGEECFIVDMGVDEKFRLQGHGLKLLNQLEKIADENGAKVITGNIHLWDVNASNTLIAALKQGFKVVRAESNILLISKIIRGQ